MKFKITSLFKLSAAIFLSNLLLKAEQSEIKLNNEELLIFNYEGTNKDFQHQELILKQTNSSETVWESKRLQQKVVSFNFEKTMPFEFNEKDKKLYEKGTIICADKKENMLAVLFSFSKGEMSYYPTQRISTGSLPKKVQLDNILLLNLYVKSNGEWIPHLSVYPQTFFGDTMNEKVKSVSINEDNSYTIKYENNWGVLGRLSSSQREKNLRLEDTPLENMYQKFEHPDPSYSLYLNLTKRALKKGNVEKVIKYDKEALVVYTFNTKREKIYVKDSLWRIYTKGENISNMGEDFSKVDMKAIKFRVVPHFIIK